LPRWWWSDFRLAALAATPMLATTTVTVPPSTTTDIQSLLSAPVSDYDLDTPFSDLDPSIAVINLGGLDEDDLVIDADQPGTTADTFTLSDENGNNPLTYTLTMIVTAGPALTFTPPALGYVDGSTVLSATGSGTASPVVFASTTPSYCTVDGSTVSYLAAGSCSVTASQLGNFVTPSVTELIDVELNPQTIAFTPPASGTFGGSATLSATGGASGNPAVFASSTPSICSVSGSTVSYLAAGTC
jgi:hypothetical protein